jgi:hypothetical protein
MLDHGFEAVARCAYFFDFADKQHQWARRLGHGDQARLLRDAASVDFAASIDAEDFGNIQPMPSNACPSRYDCDEDCIRCQLSGRLKLTLNRKFRTVVTVGRRAPTDSYAAVSVSRAPRANSRLLAPSGRSLRLQRIPRQADHRGATIARWCVRVKLQRRFDPKVATLDCLKYHKQGEKRAQPTSRAQAISVLV